MTNFDLLIASLLAALVGFQAWLTIRVFRCKFYERAQKFRQAQLIWLLPVIGSGLVYSVMRDEERSERGASEELSAARKRASVSRSPGRDREARAERTKAKRAARDRA